MIHTPKGERDSGRPELTITRIFDAPRALVFQLWTQPVHIKHWWGPRNYTTLTCEMDMRPGGAWRVASRHVDGSQTAEQGVFREIVEPERLVFTHAWEDKDGRPGHETLVTLTFEEENGRTKLTFHQAVFISAESRDGHLEGWNQSFDMLAEYLASV
jgi:uncharacterized protein YndB with AHSA1/START domain